LEPSINENVKRYSRFD